MSDPVDLTLQAFPKSPAPISAAPPLPTDSPVSLNSSSSSPSLMKSKLLWIPASVVGGLVASVLVGVIEKFRDGKKDMSEKEKQILYAKAAGAGIVVFGLILLITKFIFKW